MPPPGATLARGGEPTRLRYDRGTLLFVDPPDDDGWRAGEVAWDERTAAFRAPPWRYGEIKQQLDGARVSYVDEVAAYARPAEGAWRDIELRPYQQAALCAWEGAGRRGVVVLPTGSGKTRLAMAAMALAGCATLCLVPTRVLLHQWREELAKFYGGRVGIWGDGEREPAPVTVITFESAYRNMERLGNRYQLLVVDEAHHFGSGARDEALEMSIAPYRLGLTATPPADLAARDELSRLIGSVVFRSNVCELAGSYLADFELVALHIPLDEDERAEYDRARAVFRRHHGPFRRSFPLAKWSDYVAMAHKTQEGRAALAAWRRSRKLIAYSRGKASTLDTLLREHRQNRVLVFTPDNDTAYAIARRNLVMPITCDIKRQERDEVLSRFREGTLRALVSARVLNEGVDVPDADVAVIVGGTQAEREHIQRVGRVLRPAAGKRATVYELIADDTIETYQAEKRRRALGTA